MISDTSELVQRQLNQRWLVLLKYCQILQILLQRQLISLHKIKNKKDIINHLK